MEHLVRFRSTEGRDGHHVCATLEEALKFVEHLRNTEDATDVHVYRLTEVPIEFKQYFRVEVRPGDGGAAPTAGSTEPATTPAEDAVPVPPATSGGAPAGAPAEVVAERGQAVADAALNGHGAAGDGGNRRLFARG